MDPLGVAPALTQSIHSVRRWGALRVPSVLETPTSSQTPPPPSARSPFPYDPDLNRHVALWAGDVTKLSDVDAVVHATNEAVTSRDPVSISILEAGGVELTEAARQKVRGCKTGDARMTEGFGLLSRFVIHVIVPRFNERYATAAETALYQAYRSLLELVRCESLSSVALTCLHSIRRGYPVTDGAHLALRTLRHFLQRTLKPLTANDVEAFEAHPWSRVSAADAAADADADSTPSVPSFVFCVTDNELSAYQAAMPLYFPRSPEEEEWAASRLPSDVGGEFGQPLRPGRGVTVAGRLAPEGASGDNNDNDLLDEIAAAEQTAVGFSPFAKMEEDHDKKVMSRRRTSNSVETENEEMLRSLHYTKLLKIAKTEDFSNFSALRCLYRSGVDWQGRAVIVFVARQISFNGIDLDKALLYLINVLEPLAAKAYSIVYLHSMCSVDNTPDMSFLRRVYNSLPSKFGRNLNAFYVVHPTVFSRVFMWFFTQFTASQMKDRYHSFNSLHQLYSFIPSDQLDIPPFVLHHDMRVNPDNYKGDSEQQLPRLTESVATGWTVDEL